MDRAALLAGTGRFSSLPQEQGFSFVYYGMDCMPFPLHLGLALLSINGRAQWWSWGQRRKEKASPARHLELRMMEEEPERMERGTGHLTRVSGRAQADPTWRKNRNHE